ncbi:MAG: flagellar assembly protein FliW [Actinomycetota bacterium]|nr:flagellar assembly protein FliW [Actinomycetota bacterium]
MTETLTIEDRTAQPDGALAPSGEQFIALVRPLIGFPNSLTFKLHSMGEAYEPFLAFSSIDEPGLEFIVVRPGLLFSDYVFAIEEGDAAALGLTEPDDVDVFVLVTRRPGAVPTVNLMGPLICNRRSQLATQIVLHDAGFAAAVPVDARSARTRA